MNLRVAGAMTVALALAVIGMADAPASIKVNVIVAEASTQGRSVDPRLAHFAHDMRKFSYTSFVVASEASLSVDLGKSAEVKLPSGAKATVEFRQVDTDGKLRIKIHSPSRGYAIISRAPGKEIFFQADSQHGGADTWLILTASAP